MKAVRVSAASGAISNPRASIWQGALQESLELMPTPLGLVENISPYLALSDDHGQVERLQIAALHNGETIALKLTWPVKTPSRTLSDLDQFSDGAAVIFPLAQGASAITMGASGKPTNAWHWKANETEPYDVVAEGFSTSQRRAAATSGLSASAFYADGVWRLVFSRPLSVGPGMINFVPGTATGIALAIWAGENRERSGRKSFSGEFTPLQIAT